MLSRSLCLGLVAAILLAFIPIPQGECKERSRRGAKTAAEPPWSYDNSEKDGPDTWDDLYPTCQGKYQSPINIMTDNTDLNDDLDDFDFDDDYDDPMKDAYIKNTGHTVKVQPGAKDDARTFMNGGLDDTYQFEGLHFHWGSDSQRGSEHTINGRRFPLEMHVVHRNINYKTVKEAKEKDDGFAVLAVLFQITGKDNKALEPIIERLDEVAKEGSQVDLDDFNLRDLLPDDLMPYYRYRGSFTTPPCNEVVTFTVFKHYENVSETQMKEFRKLKESDSKNEVEPLVDNYRPIQALGQRTVQVSAEEEAKKSPGSTGSLATESLAVLLSTLAAIIANGRNVY